MNDRQKISEYAKTAWFNKPSPEQIEFPLLTEGQGCGFKLARITIAKQTHREFILDIGNFSLYRPVNIVLSNRVFTPFYSLHGFPRFIDE